MINEIKSLKNTKKVEFSFDRKLNEDVLSSKKKERERKKIKGTNEETETLFVKHIYKISS